jgi:hypothetical protein
MLSVTASHRWRQLAYAVGSVALTVFASSSAEGQRLTGRVLEADGVTAAPFVALLVVDSAGNVVARGQTTATGAFAVDLPNVGRYAVRALRVGFRPTETPLVAVSRDNAAPVRIQLTGQRIMLATVRVRERSTCSATLAAGGALVDTWDQARAALLGVMHNEPSSSLGFETVAWVVERDVWPDTATRSSVTEPRRGRGDTFRSRPARELLRSGFMRSAGDSIEFHAPDAFVLLDPEFAQSYCLWLEPSPPSHPEWIGIGLAPAQTVPEKVMIWGTLWLTRDGALQRFDYEYVGLERVLAAAQPGGRVEFLQLPTGQWIVARWVIRMPQAVTQMVSEGFSARQTATNRLGRVVEQGAFVTRVDFAGQFLELGRQELTLTVQSRGPSKQPLSGTSVELQWDRRSWTVDASAQLHVDRIQAGRHRFLVQTPLMRDVGLAPEAIDLTILPDTAGLRATLLVPSTTDVRRRLCPGSDNDAAAVGVIPIARVAELGSVFVSRASELAEAGRPPARRTAVAVDSEERWRACGLPRSTSLALWGERSGVRETLARFRIPRTVDLALVGSLNANPFAVAASLPLASAQQDGARLTLLVLAARDSSQLRDAEALVDDSLLARPNARGELRISGLEEGKHEVIVRRLGFTPVMRSVTLSGVEVRVDTVYLERMAQLLTEVMVRGRMVRVPTKYVDVLRRAASGWGTVFTREDIRGAHDLKSLMFQLPGVHVNDRGIFFRRCSGELSGQSVAPNPKSAGVSAASASPKLTEAKVQVYIDGVRVTMLSEDRGSDHLTTALALVHPSDIEFMEVYRGVAQIPVEFVNDACAVIAIWTRAY